MEPGPRHCLYTDPVCRHNPTWYTVGELVNILTGFAKKDMPGREVKISLPTIVVGDRHVIGGFRNEARFVTCFETALGSFHLSVQLEHLPGNPGQPSMGR